MKRKVKAALLKKLKVKHLENIIGIKDKAYGGISVVFSGDFHQLRPVGCNSNGVFYEGVMNGLFEGSINTAIILEDSHRFDNDLGFREFFKRLWLGKMTEEDIDLLNTELLVQMDYPCQKIQLMLILVMHVQ